jgi:hypothetical protein
MTNLSPAAQTVMDAYNEVYESDRHAVAAALRAAAEILAEDQMDHYAPDLIRDIATEIEAEKTASVSVKKQRPARLVVGDIW